MAMKEDIKQMKSIVSKNARYFYEEDEQGNKVLRHILIGSQANVLTVPDGVTIDVVPDNSVGTDQIKDGSVKLDDLSEEVKQKLNPADNEEYSENSDIDDMFDNNGASTQPTTPTQPLVVEEEEEP